jgi:hypothetical protein
MTYMCMMYILYMLICICIYIYTHTHTHTHTHRYIDVYTHIYNLSSKAVDGARLERNVAHNHALADLVALHLCVCVYVCV